MPLEPITCTNCGASDFTEVKPNTYFCNRCDSVFKYVVPGTGGNGGMAAGCNIRLRSGSRCGLLALNRCDRCEDAFCQQHGSRSAYEMLCEPCMCRRALLGAGTRLRAAGVAPIELTADGHGPLWQGWLLGRAAFSYDTSSHGDAVRHDFEAEAVFVDTRADCASVMPCEVAPDRLRARVIRAKADLSTTYPPAGDRFDGRLLLTSEAHAELRDFWRFADIIDALVSGAGRSPES